MTRNERPASLSVEAGDVYDLLGSREYPDNASTGLALACYVRSKFGVSEFWVAERIVWWALQESVQAEEYGEKRPLLAGCHLLGFFEYPHDVNAEFGRFGRSLKYYVPRLGHGGRRPNINLTERRKIASAEGGYGRFENLSGKSKSLPNVSEAVWGAIRVVLERAPTAKIAELESEVRSAGPPAWFIVSGNPQGWHSVPDAQSEPPQEEPSQPIDGEAAAFELPDVLYDTPAGHSSAAFRTRRRGWILGAIAVPIVIGGAILIAVRMSQANTAIPDLASEQPQIVASVDGVEIVGIYEQIEWNAGPKFWLPLTAQLRSLPGGSTDCARPEVQQWLLLNGEFQPDTLFTIWNRTSNQVVGVSNVVAHGRELESTPGYFVTCPPGGMGEVQWSKLDVAASNGAIATFADRTPNYFWRSIDPGEKAGILVSPTAENDFEGSLSVDVTVGSEAAVRMDVPSTTPSSGSPTFRWRGYVPQRMLSVSLRPADLPTCWQPDGLGGRTGDSCTPEEADALAAAIWRS